jgi:hypothetical protein
MKEGTTQVVGRYFSLAVCLYHHEPSPTTPPRGVKSIGNTRPARPFSGTRPDCVGNRIDVVYISPNDARRGGNYN